MAAFQYHRPESVDEALSLLATCGDDAKVLAGGQSLLPVMAMRLGTPAHLIDIGGLHELEHVGSQGGSTVIGALVRQAAAEHSSAVASDAPLLAKALPWIGHRAIRNRGTVCGSLAHADPAAELPCVALALGAELVLRSATGVRTVAAADFFRGFLTTAIAEDELLTEVRFPEFGDSPGDRANPGRHGFAVQEISRRHGDFALAGAAIGLAFTGDDNGDDGGRDSSSDGGDRNGSITAATICLFGVGSTPVRVHDAEQLLIGQPPSAEAFAAAAEAVRAQVEPPGDDHASSAYRRHVAGVLTERGLLAATADSGARA